MQAIDFPPGFLWGAATSAHQVEGHNDANDWWEAELAGRLPYRSGAACEFLTRYAEDFDLARRLGHNAHRLSLEWSRIEPEPGRFSASALDHYARVLDALAARGMTPVVTLHHFTNPRWLAARGGWLDGATPALFERYARRVVAALGAQVRWWLTINEPTVIAKHAYVTGDWPPFVTGSWLKARRMMAAMAVAHRRAHGAIHELRPDAMVSFAHSAPLVEPSRPGHWADRWVARNRELGLNGLMFRMIGRRHLDYVGINYYTRQVVRWGSGLRGGILGVDCRAPRGDRPRRWCLMGSEVYPEGLLEVLRRFARLGRPLLVTENGTATDDDGLRAAALEGHLRALAQAVAEGIDLRGYLHWTLMDNYEWALGPTIRFGLAATDYATQARTPRPHAARYREIATANRWTPPRAAADRQPASAG